MSRDAGAVLGRILVVVALCAAGTQPAGADWSRVAEQDAPQVYGAGATGDGATDTHARVREEVARIRQVLKAFGGEVVAVASGGEDADGSPRGMSKADNRQLTGIPRQPGADAAKGLKAVNEMTHGAADTVMKVQELIGGTSSNDWSEDFE